MRESGNVQLCTLEFRNGLYQGKTVDAQPQGIGLLLDDFMRFYVSDWKHGQLSGRTFIFSGHGKYLYGQWQDGLPHGFNIFRSGDIVLLGNFHSGELIGEFIVVFERQNLLAVVTRDSSIGGYSIKNKFEFLSEQDIKKVSETLSFSSSVPRDYFSMMKFIKMSFIEEHVPLRLVFDGSKYRFGFDNGLAICFNDDNFIGRVGEMNERSQLTGLGGMFSAALNEQGNFGSKSTIKYKSHRPNSELKALLKSQHRRSIHFVNDYIDYDGVSLVHTLDEILRHNVINKIVEDPLNTSVQYSEKDLNDSLEYYPRNKQEGMRLQLIRETLYRSVGRVGAEMVPASRDPVVKQARNPGLPRQMHYTPTKEPSQDKSRSIEDSHKEILDELQPYKYEPVEMRMNRLRIQKEIEMKAPVPHFAGSSYKQQHLTPTKLRQDQINTTAKRHDPDTEELNVALPQPRDVYERPNIRETKDTRVNPFLEDLDQEEPVANHQSSQSHKPPSRPSQHIRPNSPPIIEKLATRTTGRYETTPPKKSRTPGKAVHKQPPQIDVIEDEDLPKFNGGGDSPHHQMDISHEDHLTQNPSSRKLIPVVHEAKYQFSNKQVATTNRQPVTAAVFNKVPQTISPPKKNYSYLELHKKQKERITSGHPVGIQGTIRTMSRSPIKTIATSPSKLPIQTFHQPPQPPQYRLPPQHSARPIIQEPNPQHYAPQEEAGNSTYFKHQQRSAAIGSATRKYDYIRNL